MYNNHSYEVIKSTLDHIISILIQNGILSKQVEFSVTKTKDLSHGSYTTNLVLVATKYSTLKDHALADEIVLMFSNFKVPYLDKIEISKHGFINFFLVEDQKYLVINDILEQTNEFGKSEINKNKMINVEFVSANPTSSLHVGHGLGAAYGMTISNLLECTGAKVDREYYVNDAGRQMDILATSVFLRYLELCNYKLTFPKNAYQGDYVKDIAQKIYNQYNYTFIINPESIFKNVPEDVQYDENKNVISGDKEKHIDGLIANSKSFLLEGYKIFHNLALSTILDDIKLDLSEFHVNFNKWFSESSLSNKIEEVMTILSEKDLLHTTEDGNIWFKSSKFGDEKDRVIKRGNGQYTYFASDIAYHLDKLERGYDQIINVWGSDHHGYINRVKAAITALGYDSNKLTILLVQFVNLIKDGKIVQMSSRSGQFIELKDLRKDVGNDAARYYYVSRKSEQHIDFDLDLAISQSKDNDVYYIQYAHARINSILEKSNLILDNVDYSYLCADVESKILVKLSDYNDIIIKSATNYEPHLMCNYLKELASLFHYWYNSNKINDVNNINLSRARLSLAACVKQVLKNGLAIMNISALDKMY